MESNNQGAESDHRALRLTPEGGLSTSYRVARAAIIVYFATLFVSTVVMWSCPWSFVGMAICAGFSFAFGSRVQRLVSIGLFLFAAAGFAAQFRIEQRIHERLGRSRQLSQQRADHTALLVDAYLQRTFPADAALKFEDFLSQSAAVPTPVLTRFLPQTQFYRSKLRTGYYEYPVVSLLVAMTQTKTGPVFTRFLSPNFNQSGPEFFALFKGIAAPQAGEREAVSRAIAELVVIVMHEGRVGAVSGDDSLVKVEVWTSERLWGQITIVFDRNHRIDAASFGTGK